MCSGNGSPCSGIVINCCGGGGPQNPPCAGIGFVVNGRDRALGEMVTTADMAIGTTQTFTVGIKNPGAVALAVSNIQFVNAMPPGAVTSGAGLTGWWSTFWGSAVRGYRLNAGAV